MLGVEPGASPDDIKAAWRALARRNHPDLTGDDPAASRRATTRMAEINAAYAALTRANGTGRAGRGGAGAGRAGTRADRPDARTGEAAQGGRPTRGGSPRPRPTRPVTGRLDTSGTFRPRNQTTSPPRERHPLPGQAPPRPDRTPRELRASAPSSAVERRRARRHQPRVGPALAAALEVELDFGKFRGHTLGEVAAFEPSYIDWVAGTVQRDPELTAAARVVRDELDRQGIRRVSRPPRPGWRSNPFV